MTDFRAPCGALLLLACARVIAQTAPPLPPPLIITGSRLAEVPAASPAIPAAALAVHDSIADALQRLPDLHVVQPGGRSGFAAVSLRGADPNFTLVLLDGIPLNNATSSRGGAVNLAELAPAGIERIEVATGPRSPVFGSGALAGVINLIVPGGSREPTLTATAGLGTRKDGSASLSARGPVSDDLGGSLSAVYGNDGEASPDAAFEAVTVTAKLAPFDSPGTDRLLLRYNRIRSRQFPDASGGPLLATLRATERRAADEWLAGVSHRVVDSAGFNVDLAASLLDRRDDSTTPGVAPSRIDPFGLPQGSDRSEYRRAIGQAGLGLRTAHVDLAAGLEAQHERGRSSGELVFAGFAVPTRFSADRSTLASYAEVRLRRAGWQLDAGARVDAISGLDSRLTARAGITRRFDGPGITLTASHGSSFKAPSFYALGNPFVGNADLRPERAATTEASLLWLPGTGSRLAVTAFDSRFTDLIDFVADPAPRLVNRTRVHSRGIAVDFTQPLGSAFELSGGVTHADTTDADSGARLRNRPQWRANASLTWRPVAILSFAARLSHVGSQPDFAVPTGPAILAPYEVAALDAEWRPRQDLSVRAILDNVLDARYGDAIGFPSPGRRARVLVSREF